MRNDCEIADKATRRSALTLIPFPTNSSYQRQQWALCFITFAAQLFPWFFLQSLDDPGNKIHILFELSKQTVHFAWGTCAKNWMPKSCRRLVQGVSVARDAAFGSTTRSPQSGYAPSYDDEDEEKSTGCCQWFWGSEGFQRFDQSSVWSFVLVFALPPKKKEHVPRFLVFDQHGCLGYATVCTQVVSTKDCVPWKKNILGPHGVSRVQHWLVCREPFDRFTWSLTLPFQFPILETSTLYHIIIS